MTPRIVGATGDIRVEQNGHFGVEWTLDHDARAGQQYLEIDVLDRP